MESEGLVERGSGTRYYEPADVVRREWFLKTGKTIIFWGGNEDVLERFRKNYVARVLLIL